MWKRIKDEIPDEGMPCLVAWESPPWYVNPRSTETFTTVVTLEFLDDGKYSWMHYECGYDMDWDQDESPTHWMYLPELPKKTETYE